LASPERRIFGLASDRAPKRDGRIPLAPKKQAIASKIVQAEPKTRETGRWGIPNVYMRKEQTKQGVWSIYTLAKPCGDKGMKNRANPLMRKGYSGFFCFWRVRGEKKAARSKNKRNARQGPPRGRCPAKPEKAHLRERRPSARRPRSRAKSARSKAGSAVASRLRFCRRKQKTGRRSLRRILPKGAAAMRGRQRLLGAKKGLGEPFRG
jgi:hypothetical protein